MKRIFGHKKPDSDSICSSIVLSYYLEQIYGEKIKYYKLGKINKETEFILNCLNIDIPETLDKINKNDEVYLVDHNEFSQSISGIEEAEIKMIIDHHKLGITTTSPLEVLMLPVGCTSTILYNMFNTSNIYIPKDIAKLMLSAIISDTLLLKSPTTTQSDRDAIFKLSEICEIDYEKYGMDLLKAGTNIDDMSTNDILKIDSKHFNINDYEYEICQVNTVDIDELLNKRYNEFIDIMKESCEKNRFDLYIVMLTDIINNDSEVLVIGNKSEHFEKNFNLKLVDNKTFLKGVVSRKKQIVPFL